MNNTIRTSLVALLLAFSTASTAFAEVYPALGGSFITNSLCGVSRNLSRGSSDASTGGDVSRLQSFLISRNYPGGGAWMLTGYFGAATEQAVRNFQMERGLSQTGVVDAATRATLGIACGSGATTFASTPITPSISATTPTALFGNPYSKTFGNACGYGSASCLAGGPTINRLSTYSGAVGTQVVIYGAGFSQSNNAVHFGPGVIANVRSTDSTSLSFTVPAYLTGYGSGATVLGSYNVSVTDSSGTASNQIPFTVSSLVYGGGPTISVVNPPATLTTGATGTWQLLLTGLNGLSYSVSVRWGDEGATGASPTTQTVVLTTPQTLQFSHAYATSGTYTLTFTVTNSSGGQTSTSATVTVSGSAVGTGVPVVSTVAPAQGAPGTLVVIQGANFAASGNKVHFGAGGSTNISSSNGGTVLYYTIPYTTSSCDLSGSSCNPVSISSGVYPMLVETGNGTSNTFNFTVTP